MPNVCRRWFLVKFCVSIKFADYETWSYPSDIRYRISHIEIYFKSNKTAACVDLYVYKPETKVNSTRSEKENIFCEPRQYYNNSSVGILRERVGNVVWTAVRIVTHQWRLSAGCWLGGDAGNPAERRAPSSISRLAFL